jgi:hypothetical protein
MLKQLVLVALANRGSGWESLKRPSVRTEVA